MRSSLTFRSDELEEQALNRGMTISDNPYMQLEQFFEFYSAII